MHAAREGADTARARQRASRRTKVAASEPHRPPISMPRTVRWHREATSSGYARSLVRRATWRAAPAVRPQRRRGAPVEVSGATRVVSKATWAPFQKGRPLAMTSILRSSGRQARHSSPEGGCAAGQWLLLRGTPERGHAATWSPRTSKPRRHRQAAGAGGRGIRNRRRSSAQKRGNGRQSSGEVG